MSEPLKLTVVFQDVGEAANIGGAIHYRTAVVNLTDEQSSRLAVRGSWESIGTCIVEPDDERGL
jgi:hypothetical protein